MTALEPALGLLSALTSLPAVLYFARAFGAAAVHPVRGDGRRIEGVRADGDWTHTFAAFLFGAALSAALVGALNATMGAALSLHAALGAVLVAAVWPHARETLVQLLLALFLIGAGVSRLLHGTEPPAGILSVYVIGWCCFWTARFYTIRAKHA